MIRWLNVIAVGALLGSAVYAYSIKYETARYLAEITRTQHAIQREKDAISDHLENQPDTEFHLVYPDREKHTRVAGVDPIEPPNAKTEVQ